MIGIGRGELDRLYAFGTLGSMLHKLDGTSTELYFETQPLMEKNKYIGLFLGFTLLRKP